MTHPSPSPGRPSRVVTAGETMALVQPSRPGRLRHATQCELSIGGAESNVAIALARLGLSVTWLSQLGEDELGELILNRVRAEGVDARVRRLADAPSGLYLREQVAEGVRVYYYRRHAAASRLAPGVFDPAVLDGAELLHVSGITPALSDSCRDFTRWLIEEARARHVRVSFDVNYRAKLWPAQEARAFLETILPDLDILFISDEEAEVVFAEPAAALLETLAAAGPGEVILKHGAHGCRARIHGHSHEVPAFEVTALDPIGAGDAFAAGYLAGVLWRKDAATSLRLANALGAYAVSSVGDYEGLPNRAELEAFVRGHKTLGR